jgi:hypothetical protein
MKYEEIYRSIDQPEAFGQHRPMKLNGIVNRKRFCRKMKMDIRLVQRWRIEHLLSPLVCNIIQMVWSNRLYLWFGNTNYKKIHLFRSKTEVAKLAGGMQSLGLKRRYQFICPWLQTVFICWLVSQNWCDLISGCFEVLRHMNWLSESTIATQSDYYRFFRNWSDRLIAYNLW